jgi:hypothetical protein
MTVQLDTTTHMAEIHAYRGWWFRYSVHRTVGIGIPENSVSLHRTLRGAQRAAARWRAKRPCEPRLVEKDPAAGADPHGVSVSPRNAQRSR